VTRWPFPGDTPTDRARRIANTLLALLPDDERARMTARAHALGETWLGTDLLRFTTDDLLPPRDAAAIVHATPDKLRSWVRMGVLARVGRCYRVGDVLDAAAEVRRRAARRRTSPVAKA
jgi:hypothetical protein